MAKSTHRVGSRPGSMLESVLVLGLVAIAIGDVSTQDDSRMNVLMLSVDDLRPAGVFFGDPEIKMPNIDWIAARSAVFTQAYVQAATCGVSRSSLLTSRRPDSNYVINNGECPFSTAPSHSAWQSLPEYFRAFGYNTAGFGKVFHPDVCDGAAFGERKAAWSVPYYHAPCISLGSIYNGTCYEKFPGPLPMGPGGKVTSIYSNESVDATDDTMPDGMIAVEAVKTMRELVSNGTTKDSPFFMAVGFHKPHLPHIAPAKYFDMYPLENISLPPDATRQAPKDAPAIAWNDCSEFKSYHDVSQAVKDEGFNQTKPFNDTFTRMQRRAYYAAASYTDAQIGKVLDELRSLDLLDSTVIALWGDHGWHLGENNEWAKHTAMTRANRAPLLFSHPTMKPKVITDFAEFVDIYPTLADLAGVRVPEVCDSVDMSQTSRNCTEGQTLRPIIEGGAGKPAAFSQWPKGGAMGYNIFTTLLDGSQVRYTEWVKYENHGPQWDKQVGVELYNRAEDPDENVNVVNDPNMAAEVKRLSQLLHAGWRNMTTSN